MPREYFKSFKELGNYWFTHVSKYSPKKNKKKKKKKRGNQNGK